MCHMSHMSIMAFKYLLKTLDISQSSDVKNEDLDTCRILNGIFKSATSSKDRGIETCHMVMLNHL